MQEVSASLVNIDDEPRIEQTWKDSLDMALRVNGVKLCANADDELTSIQM